MTDQPIRTGGLMRCCIKTLVEREEPGTEGDVQACRWCTESSRFRDGAWEWISPFEQPVMEGR